MPASAVFVGDGATALLVGVTGQLIGRPGAEFAYRGNVAPWPVSPATKSQIEAVGRTLAREFGLVGLFGVDLILDADGNAWTVEVNPRYTASVEVLELAGGTAWLAAHRDACQGRPIAPRLPRGPSRRFVAKEVVFASEPARFQISGPDLTLFLQHGSDFEIPAAADLPESGTFFDAGDPVATVFGHGSTLEECLERLDASAWDLRRRLSPAGPEESRSNDE